MEAALRAGIALYDAGYYHGAHDAWEDEWLEQSEGDDERLLHGLIHCGAAVHHARNRNWEGATGVAASARDYLDAVPPTHRGVNVEAAAAYLDVLARDPEVIERRRPVRLTHRGSTVSLAALDAPAAVTAAVVVADAEGYESETFERAATYAREGLADGELNEYGVFLCDFAVEREKRGLIATRLAEHVERRRAREKDVEGLFG
ncbi:hypothetical protein GCM10009037_16400 [Halarchaeum grantii]|uniref:DUF309 domain-containing protein n=1 Tax=Halarchaeum grantii TaxID=1193105 RepID=A0A830F272_9EURY|nr:DUF309 domain-containing protein [Halarchaeum grantii]GGL33489.1 hypothetical protein GCM10009037_16400 [Halarchaeum grantii]